MKRFLITLAFISLIALLIIAVGCSHSIRISGKVIPTDQEKLDLRQMDITIEEFQQIRAMAPDCEIEWNVPLADMHVDSRSTTLELASLTFEDISAFQYLQSLTSVTITSPDDFEAIQDAVEAYPSCSFVWETKVSGILVTSEEEALDLSGKPVDAAELNSALVVLPKLKTLNLCDTGLDKTAIADIASAYPNLTILRNITIGGRTFQYNSAEIDLSQTSSLSVLELSEALPSMPNLVKVNLTGCLLSDDEKLTLVESFPDCSFLWDVSFPFGLTIMSDVTKLDLSNYEVNDPVELTMLLKLLTDLRFLDLSDCGLSNEEMANIRDALPSVEVVWMLHLKYWDIRTDAAAFSMGYRSRKPFPDGKGWYTNVGGTFSYRRLNTKAIEPLQYCTDMVALDIGHSAVKDLTPIGKLVNLKYLVIALMDLTDISPLRNLKQLEYLEVFYNCLDDDDMEVFLELKNLKYLNVGGNNIRSIEILKQLTWLDRLWLNMTFLSAEEIEDLKAALPNTEVHAKRYFDPGGDGWPFNNPGYTEMRELFGFKY